MEGISHFECKEKADDLTALLASVDVVTHKEVSAVSRNDVILLFSLVFITHFFKHVEQVCVLSMNITKNLNRCLELNTRSFVFKAFLCFFNEKLDNFDWEIDERHALGVLRLITDDIVVKIVYNYIHYEHCFVGHVFFGN